MDFELSALSEGWRKKLQGFFEQNVFISDVAIAWHSLAYRYGKKCLQIGVFWMFLVCVAIRCHARNLLTRCLPESFSMQVKLTAGFVSAAPEPPASKDRVIYWDEKRPGFGLMVTARGRKSFVFQYRNSRGESRRATLSGTTKLSDAHKWADIFRAR